MTVFFNPGFGSSPVWLILALVFFGGACPIATHASTSCLLLGVILAGGLAGVVFAITVLLERPRENPRL